MGFITWSQKMSTDINEIDAQHKKLLSMLNDLYDAMKARKGKEALTPILKGLIDYTKTHFKNEENYMIKFGYPDFRQHKREHDDFVKKVNDFHVKFEEGKHSLTMEIMNFLSSWVTSHIQGSDKKYVPFFKEKGLS